MALTKDELMEWFSSDEEIAAYHVGDDTVELCGYIDCVEGTQMVQTAWSPNPTELFKMYVSNGKEKKVKVAMWGKNAIKWAPKISEKSIIRIRRAKAQSYNNKYRSLRDDTNCSVELVVQANTTVEFIHGKFITEEELEMSEPVEPEVTLLSEVAQSTGKIRVYGWIKVPFQITTCYGGSRASGVIVDSHWRMRVHVTVFHNRPELVPGVRVYVDCHYDPDAGSTLSCKDMHDITIVPVENTLSEKDLRKMGLTTPKRKADDELGEQPMKK